MTEQHWLPNLLIIGAQKCGTTSLHHYLDKHPEVSMSREKEPNFFLWHYDRGLDWWRSQVEPGARIGRGAASRTDGPRVRGLVRLTARVGLATSNPSLDGE